MNNQRIGLIIGVISTAVLGLMWLQMDLIRTSMRVNEDKFDKQVFTVLNAVADRIEEEERIEAERYKNGYNRGFFPQPGANSLPVSFNGINTPLNIGSEDQSRFLNQPSLGFNFIDTDEPLEKRIDIGELDEYLRQELLNQGFAAAFAYGVYSNEAERFVIVNGKKVDSAKPSSHQPRLTASLYKVSLFNNDAEPPGPLIIYFPTKESLLWGSVWLDFVGAGLCILLILGCFWYTIHIIFRQKKVSEMKTDFINNMTHEFKTPIATISLAADSITSSRIAGDPNKVSRFANIIKQENKRMNNQVEKVLQMAQIDKRDFSLKVTAINLHDIIHRAVENISLQVEKKSGLVRAEFGATNPMVEGDVTHISNVINNLLDNANKYSPEKPDITVISANKLGGVEVTVRDQGIGMNSEARKHIFDKFYRVHTGNLHDVKGFGLGLSYVKAMMTAHKGNIEVKSELGKGSSFILFFPHQVADSN